MKLLEVVFSDSYYLSHFSGAAGLHIDFAGAFEHYQTHALSSCFPPSEYFAQAGNAQFLKPDGVHCVISDWEKQDIGVDQHKVIEDFVKYQIAQKKLPELLETFQRHANQDPSALENLLDINLTLDGLILKTLSQHPKYKISEKVAQTCLKYISTDKPFLPAFLLLLNHVIKHNPWSKHTPALIEAARKFDCSTQQYKDMCLKVAYDFSNSSDVDKFLPEAFNMFGIWLKELHAKGYFELDLPIVKFLAQGTGLDETALNQVTQIVSNNFKAISKDDLAAICSGIASNLERLIDTDKITPEALENALELLWKSGHVASLDLIDSMIDKYLTGKLPRRLAVNLIDHSLQMPPDVWSRISDLVASLKLSPTQKPIEDIFAILSSSNAEEASRVLELITNYQIQPTWQDRSGRTVADILKTLPSKDWYSKIWQLYNENNFFITYDEQTLFAELARLNANYKQVEQIKDWFYKIKALNERAFFKIELSINGEPQTIKRKQLHLYTKNGQIFYKFRKSTGEITILPITNLPERERAKLENILNDAPNIPCEDINQAAVYEATGFLLYEQDFSAWRHSIYKIDDSNIDEVGVMLMQAMHKTRFKGKFFIRDAQLISLLTLFQSNTGRLLQVGTGEGKSEIIAMFAVMKVLQGHKVDIMTSSRDLAERDVDRLKAFYNVLGITVEASTVYKESEKECYKADVVYGETLSMIGDSIRDIFKPIKFGRIFDILIVDELDSQFIDRINMKVRNSTPIPGFSTLKEILVYLWGRLTMNKRLSMGSEDGHIRLEAQNDQNGTLDWKAYDQPYGEFLREDLIAFTNGILEADKPKQNRSLIIPMHLNSFVPGHIEPWSGSALAAQFEYSEDKHYIVAPKDSKADVAQLLDVILLDYKNTGEIQYRMQLSNGLHQFLQLINHVPMSTEGLVSVFMSYLAYALKFTGRIYGLTGTIGMKAHQDFLSKVYNVDSVIIPSFIQKRLAVFPNIATSDEDWIQTIAESAIRIAGEDNRVVLIVAETLQDVKRIEAAIRDANYTKGPILRYGDGNKEMHKIVQEATHTSGTIIVATNLAGRGTDIQHNVNKFGGLHVIYLARS